MWLDWSVDALLWWWCRYAVIHASMVLERKVLRGWRSALSLARQERLARMERAFKRQLMEEEEERRKR